MRKILIIITTKFVEYGGLTTVMLNYYRAMNKDGLQIDFASTNDDVDSKLLKELRQSGSRYYCLGDRKKNIFRYVSRLSNLIKQERYDVVHVNGNSATMVVELSVAKKRNVKIRIAHGHSIKSNYAIMHNILKKYFRKTYNIAIATSTDAGRWLYGDNYVVLNNAIDTSHYRYNSKIREETRKELEIDDYYVIGNVGKLNASKNHFFLLDIFKQIVEFNDNVRLLLVGGGELEHELKTRVEELEISDSVIFLGMQNDTAKYLQAMDVFVFPSKFEGLGMAVIEAQAAGLVCFASDVLPYETNVSKNIFYLSLNDDASIWAKSIVQRRSYNRKQLSECAIKSIKENGYDVYSEAKKLEKIYREMIVTI